jgi:hypothetical protein
MLEFARLRLDGLRMCLNMFAARVVHA